MPVDVLEIFDWFIEGVAGWRYLFSSSFRQRTHQRWKVDGKGKAFIEILFGGLGVLFTLLLLVVVVALFIDW